MSLRQEVQAILDDGSLSESEKRAKLAKLVTRQEVDILLQKPKKVVAALEEPPQSPQPIQKEEKDDTKNLNYLTLKGVSLSLVVSALVAFPLAYIYPLLTAIAELFLMIFGMTLDSNPWVPVEDTFMYSTYENRYIFCATLAFLVCSLGRVQYLGNEDKVEPDGGYVFEVLAFILFMAVAIMNFNLLIGLILGPAGIILYFFIAGLRGR